MPTVSRIRRHLSFAQVIEGQIEGEKKCHRELSVIEHLAASGVTPEAVAINDNVCSFIIDSCDGTRFADALHEPNMTVNIREHCARVALTRTATDWRLPSLGRVMQAFDTEGIDVVHLAGDAVALTVLVDEREADHVAGVFSRFYQPAALKASERLAS
jgi:aspartokinase